MKRPDQDDAQSSSVEQLRLLGSDSSEEDEDGGEAAESDSDRDVEWTHASARKQLALQGGGTSTTPPRRSNSNLCPFCDQRLPDAPTAQLLGMLAFFKKHKKCRPRPSHHNPHALSLPAVLVSRVCQRHYQESDGSSNFSFFPKRPNKSELTLPILSDSGRDSSELASARQH